MQILNAYSRLWEGRGRDGEQKGFAGENKGGTEVHLQDAYSPMRR